ncbi:hypothetical protein KDL01_00820 [Actinospica durhamensis]|uniref:Uncharacterized protein n=1 Tax=Actinospica durhamensis TaxID=1508375 RepID=A0A941ILJ1_9ACTN|nr:hypothetical protein [Actinospica durhamensis]MBR7831779.1 hypothetical protein [Actinospica durhamensis]
MYDPKAVVTPRLADGWTQGRAKMPIGGAVPDGPAASRAGRERRLT